MSLFPTVLSFPLPPLVSHVPHDVRCVLALTRASTRYTKHTKKDLVCSTHARTNLRLRGVLYACANDPHTSWGVLRMRGRPPYLVVCSIRISGYSGSGSQSDNERGHQQGVDDTHQQEHWAPNKKDRCVLDGRSARWAWRTDDGGHVVRGSYVLTRPLEARST